MAHTNNKKRGPVMLLLTILLIEAALVFLIMPKEPLIQMREREAQSVERYLGDHSQNRIKDMADQWFRASFIHTGMMDATYDFLLNQWENDSVKIDDRGLSKLIDSRLDVFWLSLHQAFYRTAVMVSWMPYLFPLMMAALIDGLLQREIRKWQFSFSSPAAHRVASRLIFWMFALALISPFFPMALPPLAMPTMMGVCALALWVGAANIQKRM